MSTWFTLAGTPASVKPPIPQDRRQHAARGRWRRRARLRETRSRPCRVQLLPRFGHLTAMQAEEMAIHRFGQAGVQALEL